MRCNALPALLHSFNDAATFATVFFRMQHKIGFSESYKLLTAFGADEEILCLISSTLLLPDLLHKGVFVLIASGTDDTIAISLLNDGCISFPLCSMIQASRAGMQQFVNQSIPDSLFTALQMIYR